MKLLLSFFNRDYFVFFLNFFVLIFVQNSNGMIRSREHQAIVLKGTQVAKAKDMKNQVWVKTNDDCIVSVEPWKTDQMKVLQVMLAHQKGSNSQNNPLAKAKNIKDEQWITQHELRLLSDSLGAAEDGKFKEFFKNNSDNLHLLINAASKVEATGLSALCVTYCFPKEIQQLIIKNIVQSITGYVNRVSIECKDLVGYSISVQSVLFSSDSTKIVAGGIDGIKVFSVEDGRLLSNICFDSVESISFSSDDTKIVSGGIDGIKVFSVEDGRLLSNICSGSVSSVSFSSDDTKIVSGGNDSVKVWDIETGELLLDIICSGFVTSVSFSPDDKKIVVGIFDAFQNALQVFNANAGELLLDPATGFCNISSVRCSYDGKKIVSGSSDNITVWGSETGDVLLNIDCLGRVASVGFSRDDTKIVAGFYGNKDNLKVWSAEDGRLLLNLEGHPGYVNSAAFSCDGIKIVSGGWSDQDNLKVWTLPIDFINALENDLNLFQIQLLYQMYCAAESGRKMVLKKDTGNCMVYETLPELVKKNVYRIFLKESAIEGQ